MNVYVIGWDDEDGCWRIWQKCGWLAPVMLGWMRFATPEAAQEHLDVHGVPA